MMREPKLPTQVRHTPLIKEASRLHLAATFTIPTATPHTMTEPGTRALESQVGGHDGVLSTEDGSLIIKPSLARELDFYQKLQRDVSLGALLPYTPKFLGTLQLEGSVDETQTENLVPNILDIKLGTVLYDETASPEKIQRMIETARKTTSFETGIRLTGFQVYDNVTGVAVHTSKAYGRSIKPSQLSEGISMFFPCGDSVGLPLDILVPILNGIRDEIADIRQVYASLEMRMAGASLLVVYEGDRERAAAALKKYEECDDAEDDEEEEEDDNDDSATKIGPPFVVKLIDFAHTSFVPGQGPDEGVLLGMDNVVKLLDGRLKELNDKVSGAATVDTRNASAGTSVWRYPSPRALNAAEALSGFFVAFKRTGSV
ncbi:hypothetical protein D9619_012175 [Psilocybe cf. subviscida]|uniref:Kinase n=1 Tax=Psilocybe cf. subviscida TaxID=2480587 RepID=A0A8H5EZD7_9AGAR|nr:hypothetical protein D9619_012175 [Psilocybe cf. subviscida]